MSTCIKKTRCLLFFSRQKQRQCDDDKSSLFFVCHDSFPVVTSNNDPPAGPHTANDGGH